MKKSSIPGAGLGFSLGFPSDLWWIHACFHPPRRGFPPSSTTMPCENAWQVDPSTVAAVPEETVVSPKSTVKPLSQKLGGTRILASKSGLWTHSALLLFFLGGVGKNGRQPKKSMKSSWKKGAGSSKNSLEGFCGATQDYPDRSGRICTSGPT